MTMVHSNVVPPIVYRPNSKNYQFGFTGNLTFSVDEYAYDDDSLQSNDAEISPTDSYMPANVRRTGPLSNNKMYQTLRGESSELDPTKNPGLSKFGATWWPKMSLQGLNFSYHS